MSTPRIRVPHSSRLHAMGGESLPLRFKSKKLWLMGAIAITFALVAWAAIPTATKTLATNLPPGALLTIESPDFAALLHSWNASPEQVAWLKSANYSAFSNSRLFSRLGDAQGEFEGVAGGTGLSSAFLQQVAGKESIFAWYDISKLEFIYISHLSPSKTANVELLQQRGKYSRRESGGTSFYIKTSSASDAPADGDAAGPSTPRTVAFATRGDWLILATREDLIANTLLLMQAATPQSSITNEAWYAAAEAASPQKHGDLHMLLDLQRITATSAFRTYWIQRNITETRQYRAAAVDLYREPNTFREERTLLPLATSDDAPTQPDLAALESLVPDRAGVYRATASPTSADTLATLDEKLLTRTATSAATTTAAPSADLTIPHPGTPSDLETRIDTTTPKSEPTSAASTPLLSLLQSANLTSSLTIDRTDEARTGTPTLFVPIHSAVILRASSPWDSPALQAALLTALRKHLTVGSLGLAWTPSANYFTLGASYPFTLFVDGNTAILTNDPTLMTDILARRETSTKPQPATLIAGFRHTQERAPFNRLSTALAHTSGPSADATDAGQTPDFFNGSVASLSTAFRALSTEHLIERREGPFTHQTVTYTWSTK